MSQIYRRTNLENVLILAAQKVNLPWFIFKVSLFFFYRKVLYIRRMIFYQKFVESRDLYNL